MSVNNSSPAIELIKGQLLQLQQLQKTKEESVSEKQNLFNQLGNLPNAVQGQALKRLILQNYLIAEQTKRNQLHQMFLQPNSNPFQLHPQNNMHGQNLSHQSSISNPQGNFQAMLKLYLSLVQSSQYSVKTNLQNRPKFQNTPHHFQSRENFINDKINQSSNELKRYVLSNEPSDSSLETSTDKKESKLQNNFRHLSVTQNETFGRQMPNSFEKIGKSDEKLCSARQKSTQSL